MAADTRRRPKPWPAAAMRSRRWTFADTAGRRARGAGFAPLTTTWTIWTHFSTASCERSEGKPVFLLGHSLGGLIAAWWCIRRQPKLSGLVLSGPVLQVCHRLFPWLRHLAGVGSVLFPRLRLLRLGGRNISRDPAVVAQFRGDPLVFHGRFPVRTGTEILRVGGLVRAAPEELRTPLLILHGTADRVAAVEASQQLFQRAGAADKTLRLYPDLYHEVLNEPEKEQVLADLIAWLDQRSFSSTTR